MFITDRVRMALTVIPGSKPFTLAEFDTYYNGNGDVGKLSKDQLSKAIRSQPHIVKISAGKYRVKGRRVLPQTEHKQMYSVPCHGANIIVCLMHARDFLLEPSLKTHAIVTQSPCQCCNGTFDPTDYISPAACRANNI